MRPRLLFLFVLLLAAYSPPAVAEPATVAVSGTVTNALSGDPVPNAIVIVESPRFTRQSRTGTDGKFLVSDVPSGTYHLVVRIDGFLPSRTDLTVAESPAVSDIQLSPELHFSEVTSVSPQGKSQFESFQSTDVLGGQELTKELQSTLGATLETQPGIALRSFGPGPARPVIRGLDGDRVLIVEDGLRMGDLSSQSGDHGVNVNPAAASRIEVVRGPATLLYGGNAIGGLVNVVTNDIPTAPVTKATGSFTLDGASGAPGGGGGGDVTVGNGKFALHASGSGRRFDDFKSPDGTVPNSFSRAAYAEVGGAYTSDRGYLGASYAYDKTHYGIPFVEEGETNLDPRRQNFTVRGEARSMQGFFDGIRGSFGVRRYKHDELDGDVVATSFVNNTTELEVLAHHRNIGRMKGSIGGSFLTRNFSASGEEALSPEVDQRGGAAYVYEEVAAGQHLQVQFGGRVEHASFDPQTSDEPARDFTNVSGSVGLLYLATDSTTIAFSLASAARNPALEELYFHGPHPGNNAIENGDPNLDSERALGFDASVRWRACQGLGRNHVLPEQHQQLRLPPVHRRGRRRGRTPGHRLRPGGRPHGRHGVARGREGPPARVGRRGARLRPRRADRDRHPDAAHPAVTRPRRPPLREKRVPGRRRGNLHRQAGSRVRARILGHGCRRDADRRVQPLEAVRLVLVRRGRGLQHDHGQARQRDQRALSQPLELSEGPRAGDGPQLRARLQHQVLTSARKSLPSRRRGR